MNHNFALEIRFAAEYSLEGQLVGINRKDGSKRGTLQVDEVEYRFVS